MKFLINKLSILFFKLITFYCICNLFLLETACINSNKKVTSSDETSQQTNTINDISKYPLIYHSCYPDSCKGNYVVNELYYIDSYFAYFNNIHKLDSLFNGYLIDADSTVVSHVQIESKSPIYYVTRKYSHPDSDSSNFIFQSYLID